MTLLLTVLGAVLCSMTASSEVVPQADFNVQGVRHVTGRTIINFYVSHHIDLWHLCAFCFGACMQLQPEHLMEERILEAVSGCVIGCMSIIKLQSLHKISSNK